MNFWQEAKKYHISPFFHPEFVFLINGIFIIIFNLSLYLILNHFFEIEIVVSFVFFFTTIFLVFSYIVSQVFSKILEVNRLKSEFLSIFSHEVRRPLTVFDWTLEAFLYETNEEEKKAYFQELKKNVSKMKDLLKDFLLLSKIEEIKNFLEKKEINIHSTVSEILKKYEAFLKNKNLIVKIFIDEHLSILVQSDLLNIVLENLVENAIVYNKPNGEILIKAYQKDQHFYFEIKDTGIGIPEKDQKFIFEKFFRAENAKEIEGVGLGLYTCREIIKRLKGRISFKSTEGKGSCFFFSFPLK